MRYGTPADEVTDYSGDYLRSVKGGDTVLRFHEDVTKWLGYWEHFIGKNSFPCTGDRTTCPGCTHDDEKVRKANRRWAVNALDVDKGVVLPFKMTNTVKKKMETRAGRNDGTILTRDYTIMKDGSGLDTEYDVEQGDKYEVDWSLYADQISDLEAILSETFRGVWGDDAEERYAPRASASETEERPKTQRRRNETVDDQIDRWEREKKTSKAKSEEPPAEKTKAEDVTITEEALRAMTLLELVELADKTGVNVNGLKSADEIVDAFLNASEEPPY